MSTAQVKAKEYLPSFTRGDLVIPRDTEFLWWPILPYGHITLYAGAPKDGKGVSLSDIAARVSRGMMAPDKTERFEKREIIWVESEDDIDAICVPRFVASNGDLSKIHFRGPGKLPLAEMKEAVDTGKVGLIVLSALKDYVTYILDNIVKGKDYTMDLRKALYQLRSIVWERRCSIVGLGHLNKKIELETFDRFAGDGAYAQVARSFVGSQKVNPDEKDGPRHFIHVGGQYASMDDLQFTPRHVGKPGRVPVNLKDAYVTVDWETPAGRNVSVAHMFKPGHSNGQMPAAEWLSAFMRNRGWVDKEAVIIPAAGTAGRSRVAIEKALERGNGRLFAQRMHDGHSQWARLSELSE